MFNIANAVLYATEGNYVDAVISIACALPGAGAAIAGMKFATSTAKIVGKTMKVVGKSVMTVSLASEAAKKGKEAYSEFQKNGGQLNEKVAGKAIGAAAFGFFAAVSGKSLANEISGISKGLGGIKTAKGLGKTGVRTPEGNVRGTGGGSTFATPASCGTANYNRYKRQIIFPLSTGLSVPFDSLRQDISKVAAHTCSFITEKETYFFEIRP